MTTQAQGLIWIHGAFKNTGTVNWTVRAQPEKPPEATHFIGEWEPFVRLEALQTAEAELSRLQHLKDYGDITAKYLISERDNADLKKQVEESNAKIAKLTEALEKIMVEVGTSTLAHKIAREVLKSCSQYDEQTEEGV